MAQFDRQWLTVTVFDCEPRDKKGGGQQLSLNLNPIGRAFCSDKQKNLWPTLTEAHRDGTELEVDLMDGANDRDGNPYRYLLGIRGVTQAEKATPTTGGTGGGASEPVGIPAGGDSATSHGPQLGSARGLTADQRCEILRSLAIMMSAGWVVNLHCAVASAEDYVQHGMFKADGFEMPQKPSADRKPS